MISKSTSAAIRNKTMRDPVKEHPNSDRSSIENERRYRVREKQRMRVRARART